MSKKKVPKKKRPVAAGLLGLGLDNDDGHKRLTTGAQFAIVGGSAETHERMTETVVKAFEVLRKRRKSLHEVGPRELADILQNSTPH